LSSAQKRISKNSKDREDSVISYRICVCSDADISARLSLSAEISSNIFNVSDVVASFAYPDVCLELRDFPTHILLLSPVLPSRTFSCHDVYSYML